MHAPRSFPVALLILLIALPVWAERPHLRVRGTPRIDGHAGRSRGNLLLEGRVIDDAGTPIPATALDVSVARAAAPREPIAARPSACGDGRAGEAPTRTDEGGRFCIWLPLPVDTYAVHLEVHATELLGATAADYTVDLTKRSVELRFDPEPRIFSLDAPPATFDAIATLDDEGGEASGLDLTLENELGAALARTTTKAQGRASFLLDPKLLGPPGRGALRVRYAGGPDTMPSEHIAPIERDARVVLSLAKDIAPASPEDGLVIEAEATAESQPKGSAVGGSVEARLDSVLVGAATLDHGRAALRVTFNPPARARTATLQLRYVPEAPWFQPGGELPVTVPIRGPSPLRQVPLVLFAVLVGAWLLWGRTARRRLDKTVIMTRPPSHEGTAGISVVKSSRSRAGIYAGRVVDAHEGTPVPRARLAVEIPSFSNAADVVVSVFADDAGEFRFDLAQAPPDAQLVVEGPLHAPLRQPLPGAGVMEIALVLRRRRLLERMVQWAKRRGAPFDVRPEPTPAQIRRAAAGVMPDAAAWADAVERAAYDQQDVDARVEADVMALEPEAREAKPNRPPDRKA